MQTLLILVLFCPGTVRCGCGEVLLAGARLGSALLLAGERIGCTSGHTCALGALP